MGGDTPWRSQVGLEYQDIEEDSEHLVQQPAEPPTRCPNIDLTPRSQHPLEGQESDAPQVAVMNPRLGNHWNKAVSTPLAHPQGRTCREHRENWQRVVRGLHASQCHVSPPPSPLSSLCLSSGLTLGLDASPPGTKRPLVFRERETL